MLSVHACHTDHMLGDQSCYLHWKCLEPNIATASALAVPYGLARGLNMVTTHITGPFNMCPTAIWWLSRAAAQCDGTRDNNIEQASALHFRGTRASRPLTLATLNGVHGHL